MIHSLRARLLLGTCTIMTGLLLFSGILVYRMTRASLLTGFDDALREKLRTIAGTIEREDGRIELDPPQQDMAEYNRADRPEYFELSRADGTSLIRAPSLGAHHLTMDELPGEDAVIREVTLPDGRPGRMAAMLCYARVDEDEIEAGTPPAPEPLVLAIARDTLDVFATLVRVRGIMIPIGISTTAAAISLLGWLVVAVLRSAKDVATRIAAIDDRRLSDRLDPMAVPRELQPIVQRLNDLLARLAEAFSREKAMTANVAHELRTPLAGIRSTLEVALSRPREAEAYRTTLSDCLAICTQTQHLVENLLALARLDAGNEPLVRKPVQLASLVSKALEPFLPVARRRSLTIESAIPRDLVADSDADKLRLVVGNVLENAVQYADPESTVTITANGGDGFVQLRVSNFARDATAEQQPYVFDRFWRGDTARHVGGAHCGLGLSLCRMIVEQLGGAITAEVRRGQFIITIRMDTAIGPPANG